MTKCSVSPACVRVWIVLLWSMAVSSCAEGEGGAATAGGAPPAPPVTVAKPLVENVVEWDRYTGRLAAVESVEVRARVSGYVRSIHFDEGQLVNTGDLLYVVDPRPFEAARASAQAGLAEAEAQRVRAVALQVRAVAAQNEARSQRTLAGQRLDRAEAAASSNAIAKEQLDMRRSESSQAEALVAAANAAVASADADIVAADASIQAANASLERADLDLEYTRVRAAISGRIGRIGVTRGNLVEGGSAGSTLLTRIVSTDPVHIDFDANEQAFLKYVRLSNAGDRPSSREFKNPIYVALADEEGYPHSGHMDFVDNRIDPSTGTIRARGILRNPDGVLIPGLFATLRLPGSPRYKAVLLPDAAIGADQSKRFVMVVNAEDKVERRDVEIGPMRAGLRIVRSGLSVEERVVISGLQRVRVGAAVMPQITVLELGPNDSGLPDEVRPLPESEWIRVDRNGAESAGEGK